MSRLQGLQGLWKSLVNFFEHGDLVPLAVVVSIAHYGPVLQEQSDHILVAFMVGALIDLIHFRTVRRLFEVAVTVQPDKPGFTAYFQAPGAVSVVSHGLVAALTTIIASGYHMRFYDGDILLALPIPIGIGILAQHAASRVRNIYQDRINQLETDFTTLQVRFSLLQAEAGDMKAKESQKAELERRMKDELVTRKELEAAIASRDREVVRLETIVAKLEKSLSLAKATEKVLSLMKPLAKDVLLMLAGELQLSQRDLAARHGVSEATITRTKNALLAEGKGDD